MKRKKRRTRKVGSFVKTLIRLGEIPQDTKVAIEEAIPSKKVRVKSPWGREYMSTTERLKVLHNGKSYWVDGDMVEDIS